MRTATEYYSRLGDYQNALLRLNKSLTLEDEEDKKQTLKKMIGLIEDIYAQQSFDNLAPIKSLAIYQEFEWLIPQSKHYNQIVQRLADRLVAVDLLPRAFALLQTQLKHNGYQCKKKLLWAHAWH